MAPAQDEQGDAAAGAPADPALVPLEDLGTQPALLPVDVPGDAPPPEESAVEGDQEFLLPVHQFVTFTPREVQVVDHPAVQRLFEVQQLGQTSVVYRGASHKRGEHMLGTAATATMLMDSLDASARTVPEAEDRALWELDDPLTAAERAFGRLAALLHDIGHLAAGHTLEDELGVLPAHDKNDRLAFVLDRDRFGGRSLSDTPVRETLRSRIDQLYAAEAASVTLRVSDDAGGWSDPLTASEIVCHLVSKDADRDWRSYDSAARFRINVLRDVVGNTICADLLDYLHRDWHHISKPRFFDTRLIQYIELRRRPAAAAADRPESQVVVNLGTRDRPRSDAVTAILDLLESRYQLWEVALLHRTKTAAASMLERAVAELTDSMGGFAPDADAGAFTTALLETLYEASDTDVYRLLGQGFAETPLAKFGRRTTPAPATADLLWRLRFRVLHKQVAYVDARRGLASGKEISERLAPLHANQTQRMESAKRRLLSLRALEEDFGLDAGSLTMYCAPFGLGQKYAEVRVLYRGSVDELRKMDEAHEDELSGGHLRAQLHRFNRLWRAALFADEESRDSLERRDLMDLLVETFRIGVLGVTDAGDMRHIAESHVVRPESPHYGKRLLDAPVVGGRNRDAEWFSSGQPTARAFLA